MAKDKVTSLSKKISVKNVRPPEDEFYLRYGYTHEEWRIKMQVDREYGNGTDTSGYMNLYDLSMYGDSLKTESSSEYRDNSE